MRKKESTFKRDEKSLKYKKFFQNVPAHLVINDRLTEIEIETCESFGSRLRGLMFKRVMPHNYGLLIPKCSAIHMFFVNFPLDIIFCDRHGVVVSMFPNFKGKMTPSQHKIGAYLCYELKAGIISREEIKVGDVLGVYKKTFIRRAKKVR